MATSKREADERAQLLVEAIDDYPTFCRTLVQIVPKDGKKTYLRLNPIQSQFVRERSGRDVILKPRQIGKTAEACARDVWHAITGHGRRCVVVVQSMTGDAAIKKVSDQIRVIFEGLTRAGLRLDFGTESATLWTLPGRDSSLQIIGAGASEAAAQKKGRGGTYTRIHCTEVAFFEYPEETLNALLEGVPSLPDTEIEFESTPNGIGNYFHSKYVKAEARENGYRAHFYPWFQVAEYATPLQRGDSIEPRSEREEELIQVHRVSPEQLKWWRQKVEDKGLDKVDQEYPTDANRCFLASGRSYFDIGRLDAMATKPRAPIAAESTRELRVWDLPEVGETYVIGVDPAEGLGPDGDHSVARVWRRTDHKLVGVLRSKFAPTPFAVELDKLGRRYNNALVIVERNKGLAHLTVLQGLGYPNLYFDASYKPGFATTTASRPVILEELANAIRDGSFSSDDAVGITEMKAFVVDPRTGSPHAPTKGQKDGISDDTIIADALAWHAMKVPARGAGFVSNDRADRNDDQDAVDDDAFHTYD